MSRVGAATSPAVVPSVSVVVPVFNERENIQQLHQELTEWLDQLGRPYELLYVDDGSTDGSDKLLDILSDRHAATRAIHFRRNFGQTAAMQAGIDLAEGAYIVLCDGDLQNDPRDIPELVAKLDAGYDLVHGWRKNRQDEWLRRKFPSRVANWLISRSTGFPIHDLGCTLKGIRSDLAKDLELYGQMHRFIPILAAQRGAKCCEVVTNHRARQHGESKYGLSRTLQVLLDLCTVHYMQRYFANPMSLFGKLAAASGSLGSVALLLTGLMKLVGNVDMTGNPLLLLGTFLLLGGVQLLSLGLLGEVAARIYYDRQGNRPYRVRYERSQQLVRQQRAA